MPEIPIKKSGRIKEILKYLFSIPLIEIAWKTGKIYHNPLSASIHVTTKCNLNCVFCFVNKKSEFENRLSKNEIIDLVNELIELDVRQITFGGGELLILGDEFYEILKYVKKRDIATGFTSNGTLWTEKDFNRIINLKIDRISISLDGLGKTHDSLRGKGTFKKAKSTLEKLSKIKNKYGYPSVRINTLILDKNLEDITKIYFLAKKLNILLNLIPLTVNYCTPIKKRNIPEDVVSKLWIQDKKIPLLKRKIKELKLLKKRYGHLFNPDSFLDLIPEYYRNPSKVERICKKGAYDLNFLGNGKFSPCAFTNIISDVRKSKVKEIWNSKKYSKTILKMKKCPGCLMNCNYTPTLWDLIKDYGVYPLLRKLG
jgi:MoaA/NifB/PqqE/SkfB family radical SAM enzyme